MILCAVRTSQFPYASVVSMFHCGFILKNFLNIRRSHWKGSVKRDVLKNFSKFTGKHLWQSLFFNKVAGLQVSTVFTSCLSCFGNDKHRLNTIGVSSFF